MPEVRYLQITAVLYKCISNQNQGIQLRKGIPVAIVNFYFWLTRKTFKTKNTHYQTRKTALIWAPVLTPLNMFAKKLILHIFYHIFQNKLV